MTRDPGTVYLLHFDRPYGPGGGENERGIAKHYLGWAKNLEQRLAHHADGSGANLLRYVKNAGIGWTLARTWTGDRNRERQLKQQGGRSRMCPTCREERKTRSATAVSAGADDPAAVAVSAPNRGRASVAHGDWALERNAKAGAWRPELEVEFEAGS
jgi:predicted GIY-YIG superfamily endonuclease